MKNAVLLGGLVVATLMVTGCDRELFGRTEVGRIVVADNTGEFDESLGDAVFTFVRGKTRAEAIDALTADGATCGEAVCAWVYQYQLSLRDTVGFGPGYPGGNRTSDGRMRTERLIYQATLGAPVITERSQISATLDQGLID